MNSKEVVDIYNTLEQLGIKVWIDGGWSVDALLEEQTREHQDLDIAINQKDVASFLRFLEKEGYKEVRKDSEYNLVFEATFGQQIDMHAFISDKSGNVVGGIEYPTQSLTGSGTINGNMVRCISPKYMIEFLAPWVSKHPHKYLIAISALCKEFDIECPQEYIDFTKNSVG